jgi:hypothetical protein
LQDIIRGAWFMHICFKSFQKGMEINGSSPTSDSTPSVPAMMCFLPNSVTISALLGIPLVVRSVHLTSPSVLERINSLLEEPPSLVLGEDIQIFLNNPSFIYQVTNSDSCSLPICSHFSISASATDVDSNALSNPLQSHFTLISALPYQINIAESLSVSRIISIDLSNILNNIIQNNQNLIWQIQNIYVEFCSFKDNISITEYVRWCTTAFPLF